MADSQMANMNDPMIQFIESVTEELTAQAKEMLHLKKQMAQMEDKVAYQQEALEALPCKYCAAAESGEIGGI
jgi:cell division septum initiation protein DivIVA